MKVVLIGPVFPYRGGIAHYTTSLANTFEQRGERLLLISFKRQYPAWLYPGSTDRDSSQQPFKANHPCYWIDSLNPLTWLQTIWRIREFAPHIIILQWWTTFFAPIWLTIALFNKLYLARPLVFICHNVLPHEDRLWDRWIVGLVLRFASRIIVQSDSERTRLNAFLPQADVSIVPHPVYRLFTDKHLDQAEARQFLHLDGDSLVLLFFGMVRPYKGLRELLFTLARLREDFPRLTLVVAGEFWEDRAEYMKLIQKLGLTDIIRIDEGYVPNEDVARYYTAADLLVAPYRRHTGSGVIQVAAALNLPVVTLNELIESSGPTSHQTDVTFHDRVDYLEETLRSYLMNPNCNLDKPDAGAPSATWDELAHTISDEIRGGRRA